MAAQGASCLPGDPWACLLRAASGSKLSGSYSLHKLVRSQTRRTELHQPHFLFALWMPCRERAGTQLSQLGLVGVWPSYCSAS